MPASVSGLSVLPKRTPSRPVRAGSASHSLRSRAKGTMISPASGSSPSASAWIHVSETSTLFLSSGIESLLEGLRTQASIGGKELLARIAELQIGVEDGLDGIRHLMARKAGA